MRTADGDVGGHGDGVDLGPAVAAEHVGAAGDSSRIKQENQMITSNPSPPSFVAHAWYKL